MDTHNVPGHLLNERYDDRYFDVVDAIEEARHIHISGARIIERLSAMPDGARRLRIGETGFGAGRLLAALTGSLEEGGVTGATVDYSSVELYPVSAGRMERILESFRGRLGRHIAALTDAYARIDLSTPGWRCVSITGGYGVVNLSLYIGEAMEMVASLAEPCDAWFLDGHAPQKNPDIWRRELLAAIGAKTVTGGTVTSFTVAGDVKRALKAAGFAIEKLPGHGGKREVLRGILRR